MNPWPTPQEPKVVIDKAEYDAMRAELEAARGQIDHLQESLSEEIELRCLARAALRWLAGECYQEVTPGPWRAFITDAEWAAHVTPFLSDASGEGAR